MSRKSKRNLILGLIAFLLLVFLIEYPQYSPLSSEYEIVSVEQGAVQIKGKYTGSVTYVYDESLMQKCLDGTLKKGDIIKR